MSGNALIWHLVSHAGLSPDGAVIMEGLLIRAKTNDPVTQSSSSLSNTGERVIFREQVYNQQILALW